MISIVPFYGKEFAKVIIVDYLIQTITLIIIIGDIKWF